MHTPSLDKDISSDLSTITNHSPLSLAIVCNDRHKSISRARDWKKVISADKVLFFFLPSFITTENHVVLYTNKPINDRVAHNEILYEADVRFTSSFPIAFFIGADNAEIQRLLKKVTYQIPDILFSQTLQFYCDGRTICS